MSTGSCPNCSGELDEIAPNRDSVVCVDCGLVDPQSNQPDSPEDDSPDRDPQADDDEMSTDRIKKGWKSKVGVKDSSDQNVVEVLTLVDEFIEQIGLPQKVRLRSAEILISAWESDLFQGRTKEPMVAGGVYAAARELTRPRPLTKISNAVEVAESSINDSYRLIVSELALEVPLCGPKEYTEYLGDELSLPSTIVRRSEELLEQNLDCRGNPAGIAASVLYLIANSNDRDITLKEAGEAAGVSKETIWRKTQTLRESGRKFC
jgi:transcription initiation factor TFIIIB Brf1 subunit/transcription initiation factor TFIIB